MAECTLILLQNVKHLSRWEIMGDVSQCCRTSSSMFLNWRQALSLILLFLQTFFQLQLCCYIIVAFMIVMQSLTHFLSFFPGIVPQLRGSSSLSRSFSLTRRVFMRWCVFASSVGLVLLCTVPVRVCVSWLHPCMGCRPFCCAHPGTAKKRDEEKEEEEDEKWACCF